MENTFFVKCGLFFLNWSNKLWQYSMVVLPFKASWCGYRVNPKNISLWLWWLVPAFAFLGAEAETLFRLILGVQCAGVTSKVKKRLKNWSGLRLNNAKFSEVVLRLCFWSIVSKRGAHVAGYLLIILKWIFKIKSTEQFGITMAPKITRSFNLLTANTIMWNFSFFFLSERLQLGIQNFQCPLCAVITTNFISIPLKLIVTK